MNFYIKLVNTFIFLTPLLFLACTRQNELPTTPSAQFESVLVREGSFSTDTLLITVAYEDGDGDLGLDPDDSLSRPFHLFDFIFNDTGRVARYRDIVEFPTFETFIPNIRTAELEPFSSSDDAPPLTIQNGNQVANNEANWLFGPEAIDIDRDVLDTLIILSDGSGIERRQVFSPTPIQVGDVFQNGQGELFTVVDILTENDTVWIERNENFNNFFVDIFYEDDQGQLVELDLLTITGVNFDGRFPVLVNSSDATPIIGTITQRIATAGLRLNPILRERNLVLSIRIQDRRLNRSDSTISNQFRVRDFINF
jgi:hypothetical protein